MFPQTETLLLWSCTWIFRENLDALPLNLALLFVLPLSSAGRHGMLRAMASQLEWHRAAALALIHLSTGLVGKYLLNATYVMVGHVIESCVGLHGKCIFPFLWVYRYLPGGRKYESNHWSICCKSLFVSSFTWSRSNPVLFTIRNQTPLWKPAHVFS